MIRVQVVDDHALVREGIALILGARPDLDVVAQYASGPELLGSSVDADVVLLDLYRPREIPEAPQRGRGRVRAEGLFGRRTRGRGPTRAPGRHALSAGGALTLRERDVLALLGEELSNRDIAARLRPAERTVKAHMGNVPAKLGVTSRTQAALVAKDR